MEPLEQSMIGTEGVRTSQQVVSEGEACPLDGQTILLYFAILDVSHQEFQADIQYWELFPLHHLKKAPSPMH